MHLLNVPLLIAAFLFSSYSYTSSNPETVVTRVAIDNNSLAGSTWRYEDDDLMYEIEFNEDGVLVTSHPHDLTPDNDKWSQKLDEITFSYNNHFSVYEGKIVSDDLIVGKASNRSFSWEWKAYRISESKQEAPQVLASAKKF